MSQRQAESGWCAIVEHIQCITPEFERLRERIERRGQSIERINVFSFWRNFRESEAREVWRDHSEIVGKTEDEFAEHKGGCGETVQQQNYGGSWIAGRSIEDPDSIRLDVMDGCNRHTELGTLRHLC